MRNQSIVKLFLFLLVVLILSFFVFLLLDEKQPAFIEMSHAIFSWSQTEVVDNKDQLISDLVEYQFDRVFQSFSSSLTDEQIMTFVSEVTSRDIEVYSLIGTPEWSLDPSGNKMIEKLEQVEMLNHRLSEEERIKGLIVDVEPYVMEDFDWEDRAVQASYVSSMKNLYQAARQKGLELIVVVPYFYDTKGYKNAINIIIREASTEIAVMNYYRDHEIDHLKYEASQAKEVNKPITTIYEFKRPGEHGLTVKNTYHFEGYSAVKKNEARLIEQYKEQSVNIAYHDYQAFREVLNNE